MGSLEYMEFTQVVGLQYVRITQRDLWCMTSLNNRELVGRFRQQGRITKGRLTRQAWKKRRADIEK